MSPRGSQVAVLSWYDVEVSWTETKGVFDSVTAAKDRAKLLGGAQVWKYVEHGATRACWESQVNGKVWVVEQFIVEPLDPPRVRRVGRRE